MVRATPEQITQIRQFLHECRKNGITWDSAMLPSNHSLILDNKISQIRNGRALAEGWDELGNLVVLALDGKTYQLIGESEIRKYCQRKLPFQVKEA